MTPCACRRLLVMTLIGLTCLLGAMAAPAQAGPVPSSTSGPVQGRQHDLQRIATLLDDPTVQEGLRQAGTSPDQLTQLLPRMTDHDVHLLAERMHQVKAGGIGVIEILVIVLLVILIIYLVR